MDILQQRISTDIYNSLKEANLVSLNEIVMSSTISLCQSTKLGEQEVEHVVEEALNILLKNKIKSAADIPKWQRITSGCNAINSIIDGGIPVNGILEIVGASGVGKTQLCLQLSLTVQFPSTLGGLSRGAIYICTEDIFPSKRLKCLTKMFPTRFIQLNDHNFEDNIFIEHVSDYEQLRRCLYIKLPQLLEQHNIGLIIIDSIAGVFRSETLAVNYTSRSEQLCVIASKLNNLQDDFNTAIVCVNQVTANIETKRTEPCLGLAWSNMVTSRFQISRNELDSVRSFKVEFSPDLPNRSCNFSINDSGVVDYDY